MRKGAYFVLALIVIVGGIYFFTRDNVPAGTLPLNAQGSVTLFKSMSCGCCGAYADWLQRKGVEMNVVNSADMESVRNNYGIPVSMRSCHTTIYGDYFVEGHIPIEAVKKLLREKPDIKGIAMPGMPSGSPGMPGAKQELFIIYAVQQDGSTSEFMRI